MAVRETTTAETFTQRLPVDLDRPPRGRLPAEQARALEAGAAQPLALGERATRTVGGELVRLGVDDRVAADLAHRGVGRRDDGRAARHRLATGRPKPS